MTTGTIILLNGTSSAGKSSVAVALQRILPAPALLFGADMLGLICPPAYAGGAHAAEGVSWEPVPGSDPPSTAMLFGPYGHALVTGLHRAVATFARLGHTVLVDHILQERAWLLDCLAVWRGLPVLAVGVRCPLAVAEQRERERGNRVLGVARWQSSRVHAGLRYDLEVETAEQRPRACAEQIAAYLAAGRPCEAFVQMTRDLLL
jgi:chloramphenicol 3-O phosphotransferase